MHLSQRASISLPSRLTDALCHCLHRGVCTTWSTPHFREISRSSRLPPSLWTACGARGQVRRVLHPLLHLHAQVGSVTQRRHVRVRSFAVLHALFIALTDGDFVLPYISTSKSPQQVMGTLVKQYLAAKLGVRCVVTTPVCLLTLQSRLYLPHLSDAVLRQEARGSA